MSVSATTSGVAMPHSRDDLKNMMRTTIELAEGTRELVETFRWRRLTQEEVKVEGVLLRVEAIGFAAQDVLDMMEENSE